MKVVIDTSVLIDFLRKGETARILFKKIEKQDAEIYIPTIVVFELFSGKSSKNPSSRTKITNLISGFKRIEMTEEIALLAGELRRDVGTHIGPQDYIVAASALSIGGNVVTLNKKHFEQIPQLVLYPL